MFKSFNISAVTNLQVVFNGVGQCHITPAEQLKTAMTLHYFDFQVRLPVNCY